MAHIRATVVRQVQQPTSKCFRTSRLRPFSTSRCFGNILRWCLMHRSASRWCSNRFPQRNGNCVKNHYGNTNPRETFENLPSTVRPSTTGSSAGGVFAIIIAGMIATVVFAALGKQWLSVVTQVVVCRICRDRISAEVQKNTRGHLPSATLVQHALERIFKER